MKKISRILCIVLVVFVINCVFINFDVKAEESKKNKENIFKSFFKNYIFNEENQVFGKKKYGVFLTYGISINRDKKASPTGYSSFDEYDPENKTWNSYKWNGEYRYRAVGTFSIHYSTPSKLMGINGRFSFGLFSWHGLNSEYRNRFGSVGIELIYEWIFGSPMFYITAGVGPAYVFPFSPFEHYNKHTNMSSQFFFALATNVGHRFKNGMIVEVGLKHYSNGDLRAPNVGLNVATITIGRVF